MIGWGQGLESVAVLDVRNTVIAVCSVVIWDVERKEAVCGSQAAMQSAGPVYALAFCHQRDDIFVTGGE